MILSIGLEWDTTASHSENPVAMGGQANRVEEDDRIQGALAPPGAGLPVIQAIFLRHLLFPAYCRVTSWKKALEVFRDEGERLVALVEQLSPEQSRKRILIKAPMGIEDSSRYWSAEMVLEHLIEVGSRIAIGIVELTYDEEVTVSADIADVKPKGGNGTEVLVDFAAFVTDYTQTLTEDVGDLQGKRIHPHPWFGRLTAHQWACLGAVHERIHRRQMERVVAGLIG